ncbi:MAG: hypothetical protein ACI8ZM_001501 [Crocinitomix sp.]|jgi:hypothetical protein
MTLALFGIHLRLIINHYICLHLILMRLHHNCLISQHSDPQKQTFIYNFNKDFAKFVLDTPLPLDD